MKKLLSLTLVAAFLATAGIGCGDQPKTDKKVEKKVETKTEETKTEKTKTDAPPK